MRRDDSFTAQGANLRTSHHVVWTIAAAIPLITLLGTAPGRADPTVYYHAGSWHAFTDKTAQGSAVCGIGTQNLADGRTLSLTYMIGGSDLTLHAVKPNWTIPDGTALGASVQIDLNPPWTAQAVGHGTTAEWAIGAAMIRSFDAQFRSGHTMTITFPSGNEAPWTLSLSGSTAASATLWRCVQELSDRARVTSPASNAPPPTQPLGQAPTQPYTPAPPQTQAPASATAPPTSAAPAPAPAPKP